MKIKTVSIIFTILILGLTFFRENLFVELNEIIDGYTYNKAYLYWFSENSNQLSRNQLIGLKWSLTGLFSGLIMLLTLLIMYFNFGKRYSLLTLKGYLFILIGLLLLFTLFKLLGVYEEGYFLLRKILGFIQSPLPLFLAFLIVDYQVKSTSK